LPPRFKLIDVGEISPRAIKGGEREREREKEREREREREREISSPIDPLDFLLIVA